MSHKHEQALIKCAAKGHAVVQAAIERMQCGEPKDFPYDNYNQTISRLEECTFLPFYSEPGYQNPKTGIVLGNANLTLPWKQQETPEDEKIRKEARTKSMIARVLAALDRLGYEFEWSDEWRECASCHGAVRCNADSWGWRRYYYEDEAHGDVICGDCVCGNVERQREAYLEWIEGNHRRALTFDLDLSKLGYLHLNDRFEHGFHPGQDADPEKVAKEIERCGGKRFIFEMDSAGQFDVTFSVWLHKDEAHLIDQFNFKDEVVNGPSVSQAMQRGLMQASALTAKLPDNQGVKYALIHGDGTASATVIPEEEFVEHGTRKAEERMKHE